MYTPVVMMAKQSNFRAAPSQREGAGRGFALVTTLTIMALLSIVMFGVLSLSSVTVRSSSTARYELEAKENARSTLALASGELQEFLGPDQRVSAPSAILDADPVTREIEGVRHPHWVGVWSHLDDKGSSVWIRDDAHGGLMDRRDQEGWQRGQNSLSYLVSGNEEGRRSAKTFRAANSGADLLDPVTLVGRGSLGDHAERQRRGLVEVERVSVQGGTGEGHYAYWIGDLGTRANIATPDAHADSGNPKLAARSALMSSSKAWGASGYLTQGDLLQVLGPALTARSDTFVIRSYGDAVDKHGTIKARAWCEAVVQRTPIPVNPTKVELNPADVGQEHEFGRRFTIQCFRWLNPDEI